MTVPAHPPDELLGIMTWIPWWATMPLARRIAESRRGRQPAAAAIHNSMLARKIEQEAKDPAPIPTFALPNLVEQVVSGKLQLEKGGALSEVTLLSTDIRGFTA